MSSSSCCAASLAWAKGPTARRDHVSSACSELKQVIDQVASDSDAYMVGVFLLVTMIDHNVGIGDCSIAWDVTNVSVQKKKDGISAFGDASTSLHQAMELFAHSLEPQISEQHGGQDDLILSAKLIRIAPETSSF